MRTNNVLLLSVCTVLTIFRSSNNSYSTDHETEEKRKYFPFHDTSGEYLAEGNPILGDCAAYTCVSFILTLWLQL